MATNGHPLLPVTTEVHDYFLLDGSSEKDGYNDDQEAACEYEWMTYTQIDGQIAMIERARLRPGEHVLDMTHGTGRDGRIAGATVGSRNVAYINSSRARINQTKV